MYTTLSLICSDGQHKTKTVLHTQNVHEVINLVQTEQYIAKNLNDFLKDNKAFENEYVENTFEGKGKYKRRRK